MATISKLKAGQVLWDKHKYKMGNTTMTTFGLWQVNVIEVDPEGQWILASWNGNKPKRMYSNEVKSLKVKKPEMPASMW